MPYYLRTYKKGLAELPLLACCFSLLFFCSEAEKTFFQIISDGLVVKPETRLFLRLSKQKSDT